MPWQRVWLRSGGLAALASHSQLASVDGWRSGPVGILPIKFTIFCRWGGAGRWLTSPN